jgi:hypothetical protein
VTLDLGGVYANDDANSFLCSIPEYGDSGVPDGPLLLTNYRLIHMSRVEESVTVKKFMRTESANKLLGCSLHVGIPLSHIDRFVLGQTQSGSEWTSADVLVYLIPDFRQKYTNLFSRIEGEVMFTLPDNSMTRPLTVGAPSVATRAKRLVDEGNRTVTAYSTSEQVTCAYCQTKLRNDMLICSFCGAPRR